MTKPSYAVMSREMAAEMVRDGSPHASGKVPVAIGLVDHKMAVLLFRAPSDDYWPCRSYDGCSEYATFDLRDAEI